jgi:hypothetical protein
VSDTEKTEKRDPVAALRKSLGQPEPESWSTDLTQPTVTGGSAVFRLVPGGYERVSQE